MKNLFVLFVFAFTASVLVGCAAPEGYWDRMYTTTEVEEPTPEPAPKPIPRPGRKPVTKPATKPVPKTEIITDNLYPIPKALDVDNDLTVASLTPVSYNTQDHCNEVYFFDAIVTPSSGYHSLIDISMSETKVDGGYACKYFGSAVTYKVKPNPFVKETIKYEDVVRVYEPDNH